VKQNEAPKVQTAASVTNIQMVPASAEPKSVAFTPVKQQPEVQQVE
jgi:hypothetical protein